MPSYPRRYRKRAAPKRRYARKGARLAPKTAVAVKKIVMSQMKKVVESKILDNYVEPIPALALYHNTPYLLENDLLFCTQGITDSDANVANRVGDSIYVKNVQMSFMLTAFSTRPNTTFRITIVKTKSGSSVMANPWQHPNNNNIILCPVEHELPELVSVVYDRIFNSNQSGPGTQGDSGQDKKHIVKINLPVNRKVKYDNGAGNTGSNSYKVFIGAYDTQGSVTLDNVARFSYFRRTHFLDA